MEANIWHPYVVTGFLTALVTISVGIFVFWKNKTSPVHRSFLFLALAIFQWSLFTALQGMQVHHDRALIFGRICHIGVMFIPVLFYYFALKITGREKPKILKVGFALASLLTLLTLFTPYMIPKERTDVGVNFMVHAGSLYFLVIAFFTLFVLWSLWELFQGIRDSTGARRKHLLYFFWSSVIGYGIGGINFFPVYGIVFFPYPYSAACGAIYFCVLAYAIMKHKLFDIEVMLKKGVIFGTLFGTVYLVVTLLVYALGYFITGNVHSILSGVAIAIAMFMYEPLKSILTQLTQRFLFQKKRDYTELIDRLTQRLAKIRDPQVLSDTIVHFLTEDMGLENAVLFSQKKEASLFQLSSASGVLDLSTELPFDAPISLFARQLHEPFLLNPFDADNRNQEQKQILRRTGFEALIPIWVEDELYAFIMVGKKKSDDAFSDEDAALLKTIMDQSTMLFLSSKLLQEITHSNLELGQHIKMAAMSKLARGVHHEVRNPLHTIALFASATLDQLKLKKYDALPTAAKCAEVDQRAEIMLQEIERIKMSLNRFAQFARPEDATDLHRLSLRAELEKFLTLMREGQKLDFIEIQMDIDSSLEVLASAGILQEIFFNLFMNAHEAMKGKGKLWIQAREEEKAIELRFKDSGPGIAPEIMNNIFEEYFTTKSNSEASGIGLTLTKHRIESLGGNIEAQSAKGQGAEFILRFKKEQTTRMAA